MQIRETIDNPSIASTESPPEDVIVLVGSVPSECSARSARRCEPDCEANPAWLVIEASVGRKQPRDRSGRNSRTRPSALSLRIIVPPPLDARVHPALNCAVGDDSLSLSASEMRTGQKEKTMLYRLESHGSDKAMRCAVCEGKFGLVRHYSWRTALCSRKCVARFRTRRESDREWVGWLGTAFDQQLQNRGGPYDDQILTTRQGIPENSPDVVTGGANHDRQSRRGSAQGSCRKLRTASREGFAS